jgi:hypothetical protein
MKALMIISIVGFAVGASAQSASGPREPAGIQIVRVELQRTKSKAPQMRAMPATDPASQAQEKADRLRDVDSNPALHRLSKDAEVAPTTSGADFGNLPAGTPIIFIASILVKNIGTKTVTAVNWEYLQFEIGGKEPVKRYRVQSKRVIEPGEQAELTKEVDPKGKEHQAMITRIEYADGSFWQSK